MWLFLACLTLLSLTLLSWYAAWYVDSWQIVCHTLGHSSKDSREEVLATIQELKRKARQLDSLDLPDQF